MYAHIAGNYVHLSAHYGALPAIGLKAGDHHLLESVGFINQPVPLSLDTDGNLTYNREIYRVK